MTVRAYSTTAANNNATPPNGFPEGMAASTVNDSARQLMADVRESFEELPYFDYGDTPTRIDNSNFSIPTNLTTRYAVGNRVKLVGATTGFGRITASVFGTVTTVTVTLDSGNVPTSLARVGVNTIAATGVGSATPNSVTLSASSVGTRTLASREDHSHTLDQTIAPTWTAQHTYTKTGGGSGSALYLNSNLPILTWNQANGSADNKRWQMGVSAEQFLLQTLNDADGSAASIMTVDRTGTTVDSVAFPTDNAAKNFIVGTTANSGAMALVRTSGNRRSLDVKGVTSAQYVLGVHNEAVNGANLIAFETDPGSSLRGSITYTSGTGLVNYNTTSDARLKQNIRDSEGALSIVMQIKVRAFEWKNEPGGVLRYWLVAQELAELMPEAVHIPERQEDFWSIDPSKLIPLLTKALQESIAAGNQLRDQVQQLLGRVSALEGRAAAGAK